jgi:phosphoribosyl-ATP pyrophosphohydrolase
MADATERSDLEILNLQKCASRTIGISRRGGEPRQNNITGRRVPARHHGAGTPVLQQPDSSVEMQGAEPSELDRLYRSLAEVTSETHPRTAGLLASSTRKAAQKVIEEAGEVALEAVKHRTRNVVRESADLLYHLVALWHRAGIDSIRRMYGARCAGAPTSSASPKSHPKPGAKIGIGPFTTSSGRRKGMDHDCNKRTGGVAETRYRAAIRCRCRPGPSTSKARHSKRRGHRARERLSSLSHRRTWRRIDVGSGDTPATAR